MRSVSNPDAADLRLVAERVADRLRHLPARRLAETEGDVRPLLDELAAMVCQAEGRPSFPLPHAPAGALGDQLAVLGRDLADALESRPSPPMLQRAHDLVVAVRRAVG